MLSFRIQPWFPLVGISTGLLCAILNFRLAYKIGLASSGTDGVLYAAIVGTFEVALWVAPLAGSWHYQRRRYFRCGLAWIIWAICAGVSFLGTLGHIATSREAAAGMIRHEAMTLGDAASTADSLKRELSGLTARAVTRIEADLKGLSLEAGLSKSERKLKGIQLEAELADAKRAEVIRAKIEALKPVMLAGKMASPDPAASLLSEKIGISVEDAQFRIALIIGIASLFLSSLGPFALHLEDGDTPEPIKLKAVALEPVREQPMRQLTEEVSQRPRLTKTIRW